MVLLGWERKRVEGRKGKGKKSTVQPPFEWVTLHVSFQKKRTFPVIQSLVTLGSKKTKKQGEEVLGIRV